MIKRKKEIKVSKPFTDEDEEKHELFETIIAQQTIINEKEAEIDKHKEPLKDAKDALQVAIDKLTAGKQIDVVGYEMIDHENNRVETFDDEDNSIGFQDITEEDRNPQAFDEEVK
jgi:hypothetical protein